MVSCCYSLIPSPSLHFPSLAVWKSRKKFLTITLHAMWCHVMQCKPTGVYVHSWLSFCDRHILNVISLSILIVRSWNQPFVKDWVHARCEIHKKWWVYTAGLRGPRLKKWSMILNAAMQSKYLQIDTHYLSRSDMCSITTFEAPYLWTSVNGWAHTCCVDAWISN